MISFNPEVNDWPKAPHQTSSKNHNADVLNPLMDLLLVNCKPYPRKKKSLSSEDSTSANESK